MTNNDETHLALAQRHVIEGEQRVTRQERLIAKLDADGQDITAAHALLETLRQILTQMRMHLQLLLSEQQDI